MISSSKRSALGAILLGIVIVNQALAEHRDLAPIPDDAVQKLLQSFNIGKVDPLPEALNHHLNEASMLLRHMESAETKNNSPTDAQRMLLESKIHEIRIIRDEFRTRLSRDPGSKQTKLNSPTSQAIFVGQLEDRFERVLQALEETHKSADKQGRRKALAKARQVIHELHEKPRENRKAASSDPIPTFRQEIPTKLKPSDLRKAPPPQYLGAKPVPANNVYAFLGDLLLLAAAPDPTPIEAQSCYTSGNVDAADLAENMEIQLTDEIRKLAESLSYSPVKIYQYVSNEIQFEPYYGSLKGAMGTLYSKVGNATDQASLLIALLRASNIPARYVLGTVQFDNDPRVLRWVGAKALAGAGEILRYGQIPTDYSTVTNHIEFSHVWVEACVSYSNYRGTGTDKTGHRWIPLDASFKEKNYQDGIATNVDFDYANYMAKRINGPDSMPHEQYAIQVEAAIKALPPNFGNNTLQDVGYIGSQMPRKVDILPASLPYSVKTFLDWNTGLPTQGSTAEIAQVPDSHRYKFEISGTYFSTPVTLSMPDAVLKRITYSYRGASSGDQSRYDSTLSTGGESGFLSCPGGLPANTWTSCTCNALNLVPSIKLDGAEVATGNTFNMYTCAGSTSCYWNTSTNRITCSPNISYIGPSSLSLKVKLNGGVLNSVSLPGKMHILDMHALQAYAFQASDRLLTERAKKLLDKISITPNPNTNREETIGEFLHLTGLKYMRYASDSAKRIGELDGGSGLSGNHIGRTSSVAAAQNLFDLPYGLSLAQTYPSSPGSRYQNLLVDVPGGVSRSVDLTTGNPVWKTFLLSGYAGSAYESYLWQENAKLDAISTVRGIQYANENNIEILTINSTNQASELPKLTSNGDSTLNYTSSGANSEVSQIQNLLAQGYTITLPRSHIRYENWTGPVWVTEKNLNGEIEAGFTIDGKYSGGYTVGSFLNDSIFNSNLGNGYNTISPSNWLNTYTIPPIINSCVGPGVTTCGVFSGDPVNMVTGNMYHTERDISIKGRGGFPIVFERSYNSRATSDGPLGFGWTHSFNHYLVFKGDNVDGAADSGDTDNVTSSVTWVDGTGSEKFIQVTGGASGVPIGSPFTAPQGFFFQTTRNADGTYSIREKNGLTYTFENAAGTITPAGQKGARLLSIKDRNNNTLTLAYTGSNLTSVTDGLGRSLTFTPDGNNRISQISDWTGRQWQYAYDANGDLVTYKNPLAVSSPATQPPVTYEYYTAADGQNLSHAMKKYTLPRGNGMTFEYYMNGRVFRHYNTLGETMTFTYNDFRRETVSVNERGFERRFFFDKHGNPVKIVEENGAIREYTYDLANPFNRLSKRDPMGYMTSYEYDTNGNVKKITNPSGSTVEYSHFTAFNQPGKIKDARGHYTLLKYDANDGNLLQETKLKSGYGATTDPTTYNPVASQIAAWTINTYDTYGNIATAKRLRDFTYREGRTVEYDYNDTVNGVTGLNAVSITRRGDKNGDGTIAGTEFDSAALAYDALGRVKTGIDADWHAKQYFYDSLDRGTRATDAYGNLRDYAYDANGNPADESLTLTVNGTPTLQDSSSASYDSSDRRQLALDAAGNAMRYEYDASGNVIRITNPDNYSLGFEYDASNYVVKAYDRENHAVTRTLDLDGKPRSITDPNDNTVKYEYYGPEQDGRLKKQIDGAGRATTFEYDANGNVTKVTDNLGRTTLTTYDELNRPTRAVEASFTHPTQDVIRPLVKYTYDNLGNLAQIQAGRTDASGTNTASDIASPRVTYVNDDFGRKLKETDPLGKFWTYEYDVNNNVTKATDAKNQVTQYTWDHGHQLLTRTDHNNVVTTWTRNSLGQPTMVTAPGITYRYTYDPAHRLASATDTRGNKTLVYDYSPGGLLNTLTDGEGNRTDYVYDPVGRLTGIWAPNNNHLTYVYDAGGRLTEKWMPNGVKTRYAYNADNTLSQLVNLNPAGGVVSQHDYTYDGVGNRMTHIELVNGVTTPYKYVYDELNRLLEVRNNNTQALIESYTYNAQGARLSRTAGGTTQYYVYDTAGALQLNEIRQDSTTGPLLLGFGYDDNGNLLYRSEGGSTLYLSYDVLDRLSQAQVDSQTPEYYAYDAEGRRVRKAVGGTATNYLYNGSDIQAEYGASWAVPEAVYAHGANWDDPILRQAGTVTQYFHQDGLGSVTAVTDSTGTTTGSARYDAWGVKLSSTGAIPQYGYTGREPDNTGLIYYRARYYDPSIGRFTQRDPLGFVDGVDRYAYVRNNPVNYTDPRGTQAFNNSLTYLNTYNTNYYGTSTSQSSAIGYLSAGSQSLASLTASTIASGAGASVGNLIPDTINGGAAWLEQFTHSDPGSFGRVDPWVSVLNPVAQDVAGDLRGVIGVGLAMTPLKFGNAVTETQVTLSQGTLINRVWDSRWTPGSQYSGPFGGSYSSGGALPINANVAINARGLNIPGVLNNAQQGAIYSVTQNIPATLRKSIGGTEPELLISPQYRQYLNIIDESVSTIPPGR